jgi:hypothetical protein
VVDTSEQEALATAANVAPVPMLIYSEPGGATATQLSDPVNAVKVRRWTRSTDLSFLRRPNIAATRPSAGENTSSAGESMAEVLIHVGLHLSVLVHELRLLLGDVVGDPVHGAPPIGTTQHLGIDLQGAECGPNHE